MEKPKTENIERIRDCAQSLAKILLQTDQIERAIPYIHRLQQLPHNNWQIGLGFLLRYMLQRCHPRQAKRVAYLLEEHLVLDKSQIPLLMLQRSLWVNLEMMWNRCGIKLERNIARSRWLQGEDFTGLRAVESASFD